MGYHEKAWSGLNLMVFGSTRTLPMRIEQAIAASAPAIEHQIDSFEDFAQAYDHSRDKQNIGFIFLLENCGEYPAADVFQQLSKPNNGRGWTTFGVLLHENLESLNGYRTLKSTPNILDYLPLSAILDSSLIQTTLENLWNGFVDAFERTILPLPLQATLRSIASSKHPPESLSFRERTLNLFASNLNLTWTECFALRWQYILSAATERSPEIASANGTLVRLCQQITPTSSLATDAYSNNDLPLGMRLNHLIDYLDHARASGKLQQAILSITTKNKPGAPTLIRHTAHYKDKIITFANQASLGAQTRAV